MSSEFDHLKIHLEDVKSATNNFDANKLIGRGGFGPVYKGELSLPQGRTMMAFKRLDPQFGQGNDEFWKEIIMLSKYKHENLVSLLCFCDEGEERILGYEFASRGSLDRYLSDSSLTWTQRINICIGVARALNYLHQTQERVIHRDIKSSNILLDENWTSKVSDFGLSRFGLANQPQTHVYSNVVGTLGYCDPLYWEMGFLTKESDIYSFGVVLFELLCGTSCCKYIRNQETKILVHIWKHHYDENRLDEIVCSNLIRQIDPESLMTFSAIASRCLNRNRKDRPTMSEIIKELEVSLEKQNFLQHSNRDLVKLGRLAVPPLSYESEEELLLLLSKGFLYKNTTWLSVNKKGGVCEMISAKKCITSLGLGHFSISHTKNSRFGNIILVSRDFQIKVTTEFLVPHVTYTINLVFKFWNSEEWDHGICVPFGYRLHGDGEAHYSRPFITELREDGWLVTELYQFTCHQSQQYFSIECLNLVPCGIHMLEGIEFRPVEYEKEEKNKVNIQSISDTDHVYWEQKLSMMDYMDFIKLSKETIQWTTKKELYFLLRKGFLVDDNGEKWFSINKNMKKCLMIPGREFLKDGKWRWSSLRGSRFGSVAEYSDQGYQFFMIECEIHSQLLSPETTYSCHLIYKLPKNYSLLEGVITINDRLNPTGKTRFLHYIYVTPPHSTVIGLKVDEKSDIPSYTRKIQGHPKLRKDGWMELRFFKVSTSNTGTIQMMLTFTTEKEDEKRFFTGLVVEGIEFRIL